MSSETGHIVTNIISCEHCNNDTLFAHCSGQNCGHLCFTCDDFAHSQSEHRRVQFTPEDDESLCSECNKNNSIVWCKKCGDLCFTCDSYKHSQSKHIRTQITP